MFEKRTGMTLNKNKTFTLTELLAALTPASRDHGHTRPILPCNLRNPT